MRRDCKHLFPLISILFLFSTLSYGQAWSGILAPSRAINWTQAGLPANFTDKGGSNVETTTNPWTPPPRTQSGSTVNPITGTCDATHDCTSTFNAALSACDDGQYVLLGAGTFLVTGRVNLYTHSCSFRGSGPQSTIVNLNGNGQLFMGATSGGGSCTATGGLSAGSTSITCNTLSGSAPAVGDIVQLNQCDTGFSGAPCSGTSADNGAIFVCFQHADCMTDDPGSGNNNSQSQVLIITSVSGSGTYTIGVGSTASYTGSSIYMPNWSTSQTATLTWDDPTYYGIGVGLEDMTIYGTSSTNGELVNPQNLYGSWVKGVRFIGAGTVSALDVSVSKNVLIANSYMFAGFPLTSGYPPGIQVDTSSDVLFLNNIITSGVPWVGEGNDSGNVYAYNLGRDTFTLYTENNWFDHHPEGNFTLNEGNETGVMTEDDTFGTHHLNTYFRNYLSCWDSPYPTSNPRGLQVDSYQRFTNLIGNAVGTLSHCSTYQSAGSAGAVFIVNTSDVLAGLTLMRWGNVSPVTQSSDTPPNTGVRFVASENPSGIGPTNSYCTAKGSPWSCCTGQGAGSCSVASWANLSLSYPTNTPLPCSFFLGGYTSTTCTPHPNGGTGLSWWKVCTSWTTFPTACSGTQLQPFPTTGPDVSGGSYVNGYAYDIPAQVAWLNLPVDTTYQSSYTIASSSWSGGTETLTFNSSVLPNPTHLMGLFQLSGVNSACTTGATVGPNSEIYITGSSSTTVQYTLASNPGVSCTGAMKFPDVRQFDESVYENDPSDGNPPNPPTALSATVN